MIASAMKATEEDEPNCALKTGLIEHIWRYYGERD
ncbi:hypothetical protein PC116_g7865 [Phytophthora cactorum]|nr:hypothetical protein PC114_g5698 [Phytophthora cactorum]KAG3183656.1 hypothetical protein C6341_g5405 [Phytophthora cactorum]KAG4244267.1 hypothetical protein PC116_g7865 [Phytophthora cactorum]